MDTNNTFAISDGIRFQREDMLRWKSILKVSKFNRLCKWIIEQNNKLSYEHTGYDVTRGTEIDNWIQNNLMDRH